ncbi:MAG: uroporphyrinogen decarboxylase family protein [Thermoproteota archaeon]
MFETSVVKIHKPHRERFFTALERRESDLVPITDLAIDPPVVEAIVGRKLEGFSLIATSGTESIEPAVRARQAMVEACLKLGFDAVPAVSDYFLSSRQEKIAENRTVDEWGRILESRSDTRTTWWVEGTLKTPEDMERYIPPDPEEGERFEMVEKLLKPLKEEDAVILGQGHSGWHMAFQVRGLEQLIIDMYRDPRRAKAFIEKISKTCRGIIELMIEGGIEVLFLTDDYADSRTPLINEQLFRRFELPNVRMAVELARKHGVPVLKHSDGNIYPIVDDIVGTGIAGLHPIEPGAMDLGDVKRRYGERICILGNVDCRYVLPNGSPDDVRRDVRRCIDAAAAGGGYILTSSNSIHANCKSENVLAMVEEARRYGRYPLHK